MVVHRQRVGQRSLGTTNWHMRFDNIEHCGSTGSEMTPFLVKVQRIVNCWTRTFIHMSN